MTTHYAATYDASKAAANHTDLVLPELSVGAE
jgi:hypothetical protein